VTGVTDAPPDAAVADASPEPASAAAAIAAPAAGDGALPYAPWFMRILPLVDRAFRVANRWYVTPAIKAGLAPLHANPVTGSWMLLRTRGRRTGRIREVPLGYALVDGAVYCAVGYGTRSAWYRNILADPRVEAVLPSVAIAGLAEEVTDPVERRRAWRALIRALGVLGRSLVCSADAPDDVLDRSTAGLPLVRITPTGIASGPADPGGWLWLTLTVASVWWLLARRRRRG
jgi:deazaflavin-dependent oxidoreductase (nitroreductase family)